jgi:N-carbamoylputrescine amidase
MKELSSKNCVRVSVIQMQMTKDPEDNLSNASKLILKAVKEEKADLVCLPELFLWQYFCQTENLENFLMSEPVPGPTTRALELLAEELEVTIVTSVFERRTQGVYHNTAVVIDGKSGYIGKYRKMHIPDDPGYQEKFYFTPGDLGFKSFKTSVGNCGVMICWDQWYPEAARLTVLNGAQILIYPTAIGWHPEEKNKLRSTQHEAWELVQRSHAITNGCFVVVTNRVGFEEHPSKPTGIEFWGQSFVAAPDGRVLGRASPVDANILTVDLNMLEIEKSRVGWPFLRDRRIDAYEDLTKRFID